MKIKKWFCLLMGVALSGVPSVVIWANQPDSLYLYAYATTDDAGRRGLHCAWSSDGDRWVEIGSEHSFLRCDYGRWGTEKRMLYPFLLRDGQGVWHALWSVNEKDGVLAHAVSNDLISWTPQNYVTLMSDGGNCLRFEAHYDPQSECCLVTWESGNEKDGYVLYAARTEDFKKFSAVRPIEKGSVQYKAVVVARNENISNIRELHVNAFGTVHKVPASEVRALKNEVWVQSQRNRLFSEDARSDAHRFAGLEPLSATLSVKSEERKEISGMMVGVFFEDISRAADGGLYAELIQNRDFEYALSDKEGYDKSWNPMHSWSLKGENGAFEIDTVYPIHAHNPHHALLTKHGADTVALANEGFGGIVLKKGERYNCSLFARYVSGKRGKLRVSLVGKDGDVYASAWVAAPRASWGKFETVLVSVADAQDARLEIALQAAGTVALDMISLFPQKTFGGRKNGLRADLAQAIADLQPRFVRFPGGCVAHGDGIDNIYRWKQTVGPLEARVPQRNLWGYHQSMGLGFHEYFLFCEDLKAEPVPVIAAAVPCQNSATGGAGQQGGVPMDQMDEYIQDICDLIEYANGDARTTEWGRKRAEAGHPEPFGLKYIGIGNEDLISDVFEERFTMIYKALNERHPEITVIGTAGPFNEGSDYEEGWKIATKLGVPLVDEHYYQTPGWFLHNQDFYDHYDRSKAQVYLGEYASKGNTLYNALVEAAYLCGIERNGDVVKMTSYAPLLAKEGQTNWNPSLIYFTNTEVKPTVNYYVQQLFGRHSGTEYLGSTLSVDSEDDAVRLRLASSVVRSENGDLIVKLVNILPVAVKMRVEMPEKSVSGTEAVKYTLCGQPEETGRKPTEERVSVTANTVLELPAYSLTVLRINQNVTE